MWHDVLVWMVVAAFAALVIFNQPLVSMVLDANLWHRIFKRCPHCGHGIAWHKDHGSFGCTAHRHDESYWRDDAGRHRIARNGTIVCPCPLSHHEVRLNWRNGA